MVGTCLLHTTGISTILSMYWACEIFTVLCTACDHPFDILQLWNCKLIILQLEYVRNALNMRVHDLLSCVPAVGPLWWCQLSVRSYTSCRSALVVPEPAERSTLVFLLILRPTTCSRRSSSLSVSAASCGATAVLRHSSSSSALSTPHVVRHCHFAQ